MYEQKVLVNGFLDNDLQLEVTNIRNENDDIYVII